MIFTFYSVPPSSAAVTFLLFHFLCIFKIFILLIQVPECFQTEVSDNGAFEIGIENDESTDDAEEGAELRNTAADTNESSLPSYTSTQITDENGASNQTGSVENSSCFSSMQNAAISLSENIQIPTQNALAAENIYFNSGNYAMLPNQPIANKHAPIKKRKGKGKRGRKRNYATMQSEPVIENDATIKVYVFTCGHVCSQCNTSSTKSQLQERGIDSVDPLTPRQKPPEAPSHSMQHPPYIIRPSPHLFKDKQPQSQPYIIRPSKTLSSLPSSPSSTIEDNTISEQDVIADSQGVTQDFHSLTKSTPSQIVIQDVHSLADATSLKDGTTSANDTPQGPMVQDVTSLAESFSPREPSASSLASVATKQKLEARLLSRVGNVLVKTSRSNMSILSQNRKDLVNELVTGQPSQPHTVLKSLVTGQPSQPHTVLKSLLRKDDSDIQIVESKSNKKK